MVNHLLSRITMDAGICNGKPVIRKMRFPVAQMLELIASGMTFDEILTDYPYIERDDISASLLYASFITNYNSELFVLFNKLIEQILFLYTEDEKRFLAIQKDKIIFF